MKKHILSFVLLTIVLINLGCKKPPTQPPDDKPTTCTYPAGNRNFTWRIDTVAWWPSTLGGVWAFSDSDAYLMGYIGEGKAPWRIFAGKHWDGTQWTTNINGTDEEVGHLANDVTGDDHFMVSVGNWYINPPKPALGEFDNRTKKWKHYQFQTSGELRAVWTDGKGYFIAVGDNGMVYTKDGYTAEWVYQKAPTDYNFLRVNGVSKNEIYLLGYYNTGGRSYHEIWRYYYQDWVKLFDDKDTTGNYLSMPNSEYGTADIYANRCSITDSLYLYVISWESKLFKTKGNSLSFRGTNLSEYGMLLRENGRSALDINAFSLNDIWVFGTRFNFYHWNGVDFQKVVIPYLPTDDIQRGDQRKMIKTSSGKLFLPTEVSSQVYVVLQGTPN